MARELSKLEKELCNIGLARFPNHKLKLSFWDSRGTIAYHCETCNRDHYVDLSEKEKEFLFIVNPKDEDRPYTL